MDISDIPRLPRFPRYPGTQTVRTTMFRLILLNFWPWLGKWGRPSPVYNRETRKYETGGMIWYGDNPPTSKDYRELYKKYGKDIPVDHASLVGRKDPSWTTHFKTVRQKQKQRVRL